MNFEECVLGGGAGKGLFTLGVLHFYADSLHEIHTYRGTSIGAIVSLLLICGYSPMEIFTEFCSLKITELFNTTGKNIVDLLNLHPVGVISSDGLFKRIGELIFIKLGCVPTLLELKDKTGKDFTAVAANLSQVKCEYYNYKTHPSLSCLDAVRFSSNLPIVFAPILFEGDYILDGGLMDNFPLNHCSTHKILAIATSGIDFAQMDDHLYGYLHRLLMLPIYANTNLRCEKRFIGENVTFIHIKKTTSFLHLGTDSNDKMNAFLYGYEYAEYCASKTEITL